MKLLWLSSDAPFPPVEEALQTPNGLLAAGADLSLPRLIHAYSHGIFPWYAEGEPILWWSPDPRMVLACNQFAPSHSLRKLLRQIERQEHCATSRIQIKVDTAFDQVLHECAKSRNGQTGTWITPAMQQAYRAWHLAGGTHSVETWIDGKLVGGLYGISLGSIFFGESMFTHVSNASKIALAYLVRFLQRHNVAWIDCQQQTAHLASVGATPVARTHFLQHVRHAVKQGTPPPWRPARLDSCGVLHPLDVSPTVPSLAHKR